MEKREEKRERREPAKKWKVCTTERKGLLSSCGKANQTEFGTTKSAIITCARIPHLSLLLVLVFGLTAPASMLRSTKGEWRPAPPVRIVADLTQSFIFFFSADSMHKHKIDSSMASATSHLLMRLLRSVSEGHSTERRRAVDKHAMSASLDSFSWTTLTNSDLVSDRLADLSVQ